MVRLTTVLLRVPVIRFRKGGGGAPVMAAAPPAAAAAAPAPSTAPAAAAAAAPAAAPGAAPVSAAPMSTSAIPDLDLPLRYQRIPLSEEEIEHINGGGIEYSEEQKTKTTAGALPVIKVPKGVLKNRKEVMSLNIILKRAGKKKK